MAIKGRESTSEQASAAQLFTGIASWRVTAINPSQEQLKAMGFKAEKAPEYTKLVDGVNQTRVVFHVEATAPGGIKIKTNAAFFVKNEIQENVFVNKYGRYGKDKTKITGELRNPYNGEIDLLGFIADWCDVNFKKGEEEELTLDSIAQIAATGNVNELHQIFKVRSANIFKALATVSEGKYQRIYTRTTARGWASDFSFIHKSLVDNQKYTKEDIGDIDLKLYNAKQFELKPWAGVGAAVAATATATVSVNGHTAAAATAAAATEATATEATDQGTDEAPF